MKTNLKLWVEIDLVKIFEMVFLLYKMNSLTLKISSLKWNKKKKMKVFYKSESFNPTFESLTFTGTYHKIQKQWMPSWMCDTLLIKISAKD